MMHGKRDILKMVKTKTVKYKKKQKKILRVYITGFDRKMTTIRK